jgi:altronate hydrolase
MNNNPSPGNKAAGSPPSSRKSLGAVAKGGTTNLQAVFEYAEPVTRTASSTWTRRATTR